MSKERPSKYSEFDLCIHEVQTLCFLENVRKANSIVPTLECSNKADRGTVLHAFRVARGMSQEELSNVLEVAQNQISGWERGANGISDLMWIRIQNKLK